MNNRLKIGSFLWFALLCILVLPNNLPAQITEKSFELHFQPVFRTQKINLEEPIRTSQGDSLALHTLRFYISNLVFLKKGKPVFTESNSHHLLDLEEEASLTLTFQIPKNVDFDSLIFDLGVDSLTQVSGVMGGDLDPTLGMFWTWQSGYINTKIEGFCSRSPTRNHEFQLHLGGYLNPFQSIQKVVLPVLSVENRLNLELNLALLFEKINWAQKPNIMLPCMDAVHLSKVLSQSFKVADEE